MNGDNRSEILSRPALVIASGCCSRRAEGGLVSSETVGTWQDQRRSGDGSVKGCAESFSLLHAAGSFVDLLNG